MPGNSELLLPLRLLYHWLFEATGRRFYMRRFLICLPFLLLAAVVPATAQQPNRGYYRFPAIYGPRVVFTSEGDLWEVPTEGGTARRLTTHPGEETHAAFSPDGKTIAFSANYEGPTEVYTMPASGGLPTRRTFEGSATVVGWTPDGKILYATRRYSDAARHAAGHHRRREPRRAGAAEPGVAGQLRHQRARPCSSRACRFRAATPNATRAARRRTSGSTRRDTKPRR